MASYEIDAGIPAAWVKVTPFGPSRGEERVVAGVEVVCSHCGAPERFYRPMLDGAPSVVVACVERHNRCAAEVAA